MKKLLIVLMFFSSFAYGQSTNTTNTKFPNGLAAGNGVTPKPTSGLTAGAIWYTTGVGFQVYNGTDWVTLGAASGGGVTSFNSRTGIVVPESYDYSGFYVPLGRTLTINGTTQDLTANRIFNVGTVTSVGATAGLGISVGGSSPITSSGTYTITNTLPDQTVVLNGGSGIGITGIYPNFTISNTDPSSGGTVTSITPSYGLTPQSAITNTGSFRVDTAQIQTVANFFPKGDTRWLKIGDAPTLSATSPIFYSSGVISSQAASGSQNGYLTSTDWTTFNGKIGGSGTAFYIPYFNTSSTITNSPMRTDGYSVGFGKAPSGSSGLSIEALETIDTQGDINADGNIDGGGHVQGAELRALNIGAYYGSIKSTNLTGNRTYELPNTSGTFLLDNGSGSGLSGVVLTSTNQSIAGVKTFTNNIDVSTTSASNAIAASSTNSGGRVMTILGNSTLEPLAVNQQGSGKLAVFNNNGNEYAIIRNNGSIYTRGQLEVGNLLDGAASDSVMVHRAIDLTVRKVGTTGTGSAVFSASPTFTGTPTAPTATGGTNTTQVATTAFVQAAMGGGSVWTRTGTTLSPTNSGDNIEVIGTSGTKISGSATNGYGISGQATTGYGVFGSATTGVAGTFQNQNTFATPALLVTNFSTGYIATFGNSGGAKTIIKNDGSIIWGNATASTDAVWDASKNLISNPITGTGSGVRATSPTLVTPNIGAATATTINASGQITVGASTGTIRLGTNPEYTALGYSGGTTTLQTVWASTSAYMQLLANSVGIKIYGDGTVYNAANTTVFNTTSDSRIKTNIKSLGVSIDKLMSLKPVTYDYSKNFIDFKKLNVSGAKTKDIFGFIADDYEKVFPEYVTRSNEEKNLGIKDLRSIDTSPLIPVIVKSIQEQQTNFQESQKRIEALENLIKKLESRIKALEK